MKKLCFIIGLLLIQTVSIIPTHAQPDSSKQDSGNSFRNKAITKKAIGSITRRVSADTMFTIKSEDAFLPYEGKIIRKIYIEQIGFDRTIVDTVRTIKTFFARAANTLHNDTKAWVIRNNLFIKEGKPLNPYRLADNERYLRDLDFILDSRIFVLHESEESDTVDLLVMTRDVFSFGATASAGNATQYKFKIQDANFAGMGQRLQLTGLWDANRNPQGGQEYLYRKVNLFGSFIDGSIAYTTMNSGVSAGLENESSYYIRLNRPLFNPFTRWAGAVEYSNNWSTNVYKKPDSTFARYRYNIQDAWAGYSFGQSRLPNSTREDRNRKFVALRAYQKNFSEFPTIKLNEVDRLVYDNRVTVLGQVSLFRQDFYKTRYVLGFGRTEDIPTGYRLSFTSGWEKERGMKRGYTGGELYWNYVNRDGTFYTYGAKLASYWEQNKSEDAILLLNLTRYSKAYEMGRFRVRHQDEINYTSQLNPRIKKQIDIRDLNGIYGFKPDSLVGVRRLTFRTETVVFTPWKLIGFHLAPVVRIDLAYLAQPKEELFRKGNFFSGFSGALRARNENLIFNTVEARVYYYPKTVERIAHTQFEFRVNLRIKYPTSLITAPATVYDP